MNKPAPKLKVVADDLAATPVVVPQIVPGQVYRIGALTRTLGLRPTSIPRELREGRLRYSKRCGTIFISGQAVLDWLAAAEKQKLRRDEP